MTTTAFSLLAQDMELTENEQRIIIALLSATPVAVTGQETMVPMSRLCVEIGLPLDGLNQRMRGETTHEVTELLMDLACKTISINTAKGGVSFSLIQGIFLGSDSYFLNYTVNLTFINIMKHLKVSRNLQKLF